jgi:hypothetical protein
MELVKLVKSHQIKMGWTCKALLWGTSHLEDKDDDMGYWLRLTSNGGL